MWLLNTDSLRLEHHIEPDPNVQKYAILSHVWGAEEVTFEEMTAWEFGSQVEKKAGFDKIKRCCEQAKANGLLFAWVDTCCIDKRSSAELSESINSMFKWYQEAQVCYVIMDDVPIETALKGPRASFPQSRWFTRGWTLQELIAPSHVEFFSGEWQMIGTKKDLYKQIHTVTLIDEAVLLGTKDVRQIAVGRRMSWAAKRKTTRTEDLAYCLLGLFDVNMPMLYGEGKKAFIRLQQEILRQSDDHTIFAWTNPLAADTEECGLLAPHPACFEHSADWLTYDDPRETTDMLKVEMSNRGICIRARVVFEGTKTAMKAFLQCFKNGSASSFAFIYIHTHFAQYTMRTRAAKLGEDHVHGTFVMVTIPLYQRSREIARPPRYSLFSLNFEFGRAVLGMLDGVSYGDHAIRHGGEPLAIISKANELNDYGYGATCPGVTIMAIRLGMPLSLNFAAFPTSPKVHVLIGVLKNGKLGAKLYDESTVPDINDPFEGVVCPGQHECFLSDGRKFLLKIAELDLDSARFGDSGIHLTLDQIHVFRRPIADHQKK